MDSVSFILTTLIIKVNNELNYAYKPNPIKDSPQYLILTLIFGGLLLTPWVIYTTIISFIKSKDIVS